ncbi:MAG TPA: fused MFS/spermidine synthase [Gemmataceae bacterium]|nr:fused MFS/spermidine synthase [Gemmataceae bacterium]
MPVIITLVVFVNAALLFLVEPMVGKLVLPYLGGVPVVWNTCIVFFQTALLAGYACAHWATTRLRPRWQFVLFVLLQPLALAVLPLHIPGWALETVPQGVNPLPWLLSLLVVAIGLPFFVVAMTGPLLQKWFADSGYPSARDPYFLYAASNAGSLLGLLGYPVLIEWFFQIGLVRQAALWKWGYIGLVSAVGLTMLYLVCRRPAVGAVDIHPAQPVMERITTRRRLRWVALAFLPSSLMLGVTTYLSTDITPMPLLWVIPLGLYLLTFTIVFSRRPVISHSTAGRLLPLLILPLTLLLAAPGMMPPLAVTVVVHLAAFFVAALYCHGLVARDRPNATHLTEYYLWLAFGGILGGLFNTLVAPAVFNSVVEYPLVIVLVCLARLAEQMHGDVRRLRVSDFLVPVGLAGLTAGLVFGMRFAEPWPAHARLGLMFGVPVVLCYFLVDRPVRFALGVAAVLLASNLDVGPEGRPIYATRSYFSVLRVTEDPSGRFHQLIHARTIHGRQQFAPEIGRQPLSYYYHMGPAGRIFDVVDQRFRTPRIGVVGLGIGGLAAYARPGEHWTFYEIDEAVERIATTPAYFTFLGPDCPADFNIILGDGRLRLQEAPDHSYDVLVLDAFNSDAVPQHLLTREAFQLYLQKLTPHGLLAFNISNRYLNLKPVIANEAAAAGLLCHCSLDSMLTAQEREQGFDLSEWAVLARSREDLGKIAHSGAWEPMKPSPKVPLWTDDFCDILSIFKSEWPGDE